MFKKRTFLYGLLFATFSLMPFGFGKLSAEPQFDSNVKVETVRRGGGHHGGGHWGGGHWGHRGHWGGHGTSFYWGGRYGGYPYYYNYYPYYYNYSYPYYYYPYKYYFY